MREILLRAGDDLRGVADDWDALPDTQGEHANIFDSLAWLEAWERCRPRREKEPLVIFGAV